MPVFINNVDDYLGPSQACVNPLFAPPPKPPPSSSSDLHHVNDNDGSNISNGAITTATTTTSTNNNANPASQRVVQNRRIRRRAPRIIKCEEGSEDTPTTIKSQQPIRLLAADEKEVNDNEIIHDNLTTSPPVINTTTTQTTHTIKRKKATVTLSDCLSCSGCVTSAEAVLMSHHSIDTLREIASSSSQSQHEVKKKKRIVFTISSASLADLYRHLYLESDDEHEISASLTPIPTKDANKSPSSSLNPSRNEFLTNISSFLHTEFNAIMIIDGAFTQHVSLIESAFEFCYRYRKNNTSHKDEGDDMMEVETTNESTCSSMPSVAVSSTRTRYINKQPDNSGNSDNVMMEDDDTLMEITTLNHPPGRINEEDLVNNNNLSTSSSPSSSPATLSPIQSNSLPMLTSSCPGFVCLVEKTTPSIVPLLSSTKSPMSIAGVLVKTSSSSSSQYNMKNKNDDHLDKDLPMVVGKDDNDDVLNDYYHVAIMPCHDKKLEAGRGDFAWEKQVLLRYGNKSQTTAKTGIPNNVNDGEGEEGENLVNEVDLVLTTGELLEILSDAVTKQQNVKEMNGDASTLISQHPDESNETTSPSVNEIRHMLARNNVVHDSCTLMTTNNDKLLLNEKMNDVELDTGVHGSGSYADFIFRYAAHELFGYKLPHDEALPWKSSSSTYTATSTAASGKNNNTTTTGVIRRRRRRQETTDLREVTLYKHNDGSYSCCDETMDGSDGTTNRSKPVLRFATAYGFKNVQLILQSLSSNKTTTPSYSTSSSSTTTGYDYVEVMACPSGCSNGGGQIGSYGKRETPRETKERVRKTVSAVPLVRPTRSVECNSSLATTLCDCSNNKQGDLIINDAILESESFGKHARELFHTRFHVVPKLELSTGATAGVAVNDTKW